MVGCGPFYRERSGAIKDDMSADDTIALFCRSKIGQEGEHIDQGIAAQIIRHHDLYRIIPVDDGIVPFYPDEGRVSLVLHCMLSLDLQREQQQK
jgi:hypothetical protein